MKESYKKIYSKLNNFGLQNNFNTKPDINLPIIIKKLEEEEEKYDEDNYSASLERNSSEKSPNSIEISKKIKSLNFRFENNKSEDSFQTIIDINEIIQKNCQDKHYTEKFPFIVKKQNKLKDKKKNFEKNNDKDNYNSFARNPTVYENFQNISYSNINNPFMNYNFLNFNNYIQSNIISSNLAKNTKLIEQAILNQIKIENENRTENI